MAGADFVLQREFCHFVLKYYGDTLKDAEIIAPDTIPFDSNMEGRILINRRDDWQPVVSEPYVWSHLF